MKRPIAVAVGIGVALVATTSPGIAQSARGDASVRSPGAEFRITFESGGSPWSRNARRVGVDCVRCEPIYVHDQERYYEEAWYELPEHERERLKDLREHERERLKDIREAEREYLKDVREAEREYQKDLRESHREWWKDQREREREYLKRQRELERDYR